MRKRFSEEQIIGFLSEAEAGVAVKDLCRRHGFSEASYYLGRSKFGGMSAPDAKRLMNQLPQRAGLRGRERHELLVERDVLWAVDLPVLGDQPIRRARPI